MNGPSSARSLSAAIGAIGSSLKSLVDSGATPGICLTLVTPDTTTTLSAGEAVVRSGRQLSPSSRFPLGCLMKLLVSALILEDHIAGIIDLDRPICEYLPDLVGQSRARTILIRHLLSHTGGYREPSDQGLRWSMGWDDLCTAYRERLEVFPPGAVWSYTQTGHVLLARLLESLHGRSLLDILQQRIFDPLCVIAAPSLADATSLHMWSSRTNRFEAVRAPTDRSILRASISDLALSTLDLAKIGRWLIGLEPHSLAASARRLLFATVVDIPVTWNTRRGERTPLAYGLGVGCYGPFWGHTGSYLGSTSSLYLEPTRGLVVAVSMNAWQPPLRDHIAFGVLSAVGAIYGAGTVPRGVTDAPQLCDFTGAFAPLMLMLPGLELSVNGVLNLSLVQGVPPVLAIENGALHLSPEDSITPSLAFFRHPESGRRALRVGYSAYIGVDG